MGSPAVDIHSMPIRPQLDPDRPVTPLEALRDGSEIAADQFVDWLADEAPREVLYHIIINRQDDADVKAAAKAWGREVQDG